jgi:hypothetical protein
MALMPFGIKRRRITSGAGRPLAPTFWAATRQTATLSVDSIAREGR